MPDRAGTNCRIVPYAGAHREPICGLAQELWSDDPRLNAAYLDWKYFRNPYIAEPLIYLAFDGDTLIGMRGVFGSRWQVGSDGFTLPYADDLVIAPAFRGRWLHQRIMAHALDDLAGRGYRYLINLSASRATAVGSTRMRWRSCGGVRPLHRRTGRKEAGDRLARRVKRLPLLWRAADAFADIGLPEEGAIFDRILQRLAGGGTDGLMAAPGPRATEMADLVTRQPYDGRIRHLRDTTYFHWRYANPLRRYLFLYAGSTGLDGYLVLQHPLGLHQGRASIVDWEAADDAVLERLLSEVVSAGFPELYTWGSACRPGAEEILARSGFVPATAEYEKTILVRPIRDEEIKSPCPLGTRRLDRGEDWDLRMIYSLAG